MNGKKTIEPAVFRGDPVRMASLARLASGFAHDMNNLLGAIEGYAALAAASLPADSQARKDMESVSDAVRAAADLTGRMLVFARRRALKKAACRAEELVEAAAARARYLAPAGVDVSAAAAPAALQADAARLGQALDLLVSNALAAMPSGGKLTLVAAAARVKTPAGAEADFLRFSVGDTGDGMSPEVLEHVFEPYYSARPGGKGLGLALVYGIAALHGGWAEAASGPGKGSEISIFMPVA